MNEPIKLFFENEKAASISNFSYETPWASGQVNFLDKEFFLKLTAVTTMSFYLSDLDEMHLSDAEEDSLWAEKLLSLGINEDDLDLIDNGKWVLEPSGEGKLEIFSVKFYNNGFMDWRM